MNYQDAEQAWCKFTASDDFLSQGACLVNFEAQHPPGSFDPGAIPGTALVIGLLLVVTICRRKRLFF